MKTFFKILFGIVFMALIVFGVLYFLFVKRDTTTEPTPGNTTSGYGTAVGGTPNPTGGSTGTVSTSTEVLGEGERYVRGRALEKIKVLDFTASTTANTSEYIGKYYLLNTATGTPAFQITFTAKDDFFQVSLESNPLGVVRKNAEQFLLQVLGIDEKTACRLNHSVGTIASVNDIYAGKNLEFSFCPNAVLLPEI